jgi:phloretin hydrolase
VSAVDDLSRLLDRPMSPPAEEVLRAIAAGPMDAADALSPGELRRLLEPGDLPGETGWCRLRDGSGYTAVRTAMPGIDGEMLDWWFDWHPHDPLRYRIWFPGAHEDISWEPAATPPPGDRGKPYWNTVHGPLEDVGLGMQRLRIRFLDPVEFGFPRNALRDPSIATIVCGIVGDERRRAWHTRLCHFARRTPDGVELRSRFWLGAELRLFSTSPLASPVNMLLSRPVVRRRVVPRRAPEVMAAHCAAEFANLASLLPPLYREHRQAPRPRRGAPAPRRAP